jgi:hypothetical protein
MFTVTECQATAARKIAEAEINVQHRRRLLTAAKRGFCLHTDWRLRRCRRSRVTPKGAAWGADAGISPRAAVDRRSGTGHELGQAVCDRFQDFGRLINPWVLRAAGEVQPGNGAR